MGDYSQHLAAAFRELGVHCMVLFESPETPWPSGLPESIKKISAGLPEKPLLSWQYTPASFAANQLPAWWPSLMRELARKGFRQLIVFHEVALRTNSPSLLQNLRGWLQLRIARRANALAEASFTSSRFYQAYFTLKVPLRVPVGANILPVEGENRLDDKLTIFCFASRCSASLLSALAAVSGLLPLRIVVAGKSNPLAEKLLEEKQPLFSNQAHFNRFGAMPAEGLAALLSGADIVALAQPLNKQGEGGVSGKNGLAMAALAASAALVTTRGDMTDTDWFLHNQNCLLVDADDYNAWYKQLLSLVTESDTRAGLQQQGLETYSNRFSWKEIAATQLNSLA